MKIMKRSVRSVILVAVVIAAASPSPAFADASGRAQDVNVVRICAGQAIDLDDANGLPLPVERQQSLRDHAEFRCAHPELASRGSSSTASSPEAVHVDSEGYYPVANLDIQPGQVTWLATVGGMPVGRIRRCPANGVSTTELGKTVERRRGPAVDCEPAPFSIALSRASCSKWRRFFT
ncbi:hypothetical protein [Clavibacter michiganensis]|uniref:hypothetical protein n=1 Tax=Clavibacter michiganensis TaxID=28447 RepID=UPI001055D704|nr:hypothetical protein [Clavibacter michiganensis]